MAVYIALGANLGDRRATMAEALRMLPPDVIVEAVSPLYESEPQLPAPPPSYYNAAARVRTTLAPHDLLRHLKAIEQRLGRTDTTHWAPRPIDLDIALYDDLVLDDPELVIPHPRMQERAFVLQPLLDLDPALLHLRLGVTLASLLQDGGLVRIAPAGWGGLMRVMLGTKVVEAPQGWRTALVLDEPRVVVDVGAGDGRWSYESAKENPDTVFIAIDPDATNLAEYAYRASRKPARGGVDNAAFVVAPVEALPHELDGIADVVRVNFPWGSLLRGLLEADAVTLAPLKRIAKRGGSFEAVMSYEPSHDTNAFAGDPLPALNEDYIDRTLTSALAQRGLSLTQRRQMFRDEALALPSTWGRRLLHARPRDVYYIEGVFV